jgi:arylsulfatase A-like enzyme
MRPGKTVLGRVPGWALAVWLLFSAGAFAASRPNIVFFLVDDLGWRDVGCYGSSFYETPHMDALAAQGMRFTEAYAAHPRCVPSRYAIMTGKFPARAGVPGRSYNLDPEEQTFAEALKARGYTTFFAGKWHLSKRPEQEPQQQGFDINVGGGAAGAPRSYFFPYNESKAKGHNTAAPIQGLDEGVPGEYLTDRLTRETVAFLRGHSRDKPNRPFLAVLAHYAVHTPLEAKKDDVASFEAKAARTDFSGPAFADRDGTTKLRQDNPVYAGMVRSTDQSLGAIVETLEALDLAENTVVVLTSDHGGLSNRGRTSQRPLATSNLPLRAGKGHLYEGGIRVPLIVRWPGRIPAHAVSSTVVNGTDHFATFVELAGLDPVPAIDSTSYLPACLGRATERSSPLFWHSPKGRPQSTGDRNSSAVRRGDWKLIDFYDEGQRELYDLAADPGEARNLAAARPGTTAELFKQLDDWRKRVGVFYDGASAARPKTKVFLLAGQSNMDGRGDGTRLTEDDLARLERVRDRVRFAYNRKDVAPLQVSTPEPHIARKFKLTRTFGPELFFGLDLAEAWPGEQLLLIKRSQGGTSLHGCWNPDWTEAKAAAMGEEDKPPLYRDLVAYVQEVLAAYPADSYEICGMLWVQGETDGNVARFGAEPAASYGTNLRNLVQAIRRDTGVGDLPFLLLEVGSEQVREGMRQTARTMDNVTSIPQSTEAGSPHFLPKYGPPTGHYDYQGMKRIGEQFAASFLRDYGSSAP